MKSKKYACPQQDLIPAMFPTSMSISTHMSVLTLCKKIKLWWHFQEMEPRVGEALCRLFPPDENIDIRAIALKAKRACKERLKDGSSGVGPYHSATRYPEAPRLGPKAGGPWSSPLALFKNSGYKGVVAIWGVDSLPGWLGCLVFYWEWTWT